MSTPRHARAIARALFGAIAALWLLSGCQALNERARIAIYRPTAGAPANPEALAPGDERWHVRWHAAGSADEQRVQLWWLPHPDRDAPTLLYLHGTFRTLYRNHPKMKALRESGFSVLAVEYRGWGESSALVPSERSIHDDADIGWAELVRRQPDARKRVIFGHSMGGAVAVHLAARQAGRGAYGALILESTFTRIPDVAAQRLAIAGPVAEWTGQRMDSASRIARIDVPILMLHGDADRTVPFVLGQRLFALAPEPKRFIAMPGGSHSDLHVEHAAAYREAMGSVAQRLRSPR